MLLSGCAGIIPTAWRITDAFPDNGEPGDAAGCEGGGLLGSPIVAMLIPIASGIEDAESRIVAVNRARPNRSSTDDTSGV